MIDWGTALDIFIIICFIAVFAALVEFACTNFLDNFVKRKKASNEAKEKEREAKAEVFRKKQERSIAKAVKQVWSLHSGLFALLQGG